MEKGTIQFRVAGAIKPLVIAGASIVASLGAEVLPVDPPRPAPTRALLITVDGLRPDAVTPELTPSIARLAAEGSSTFTARSLSPTYTIPNHVSMLTGLTPLTHEVTMISDPGNLIVDGTVTEIAHAVGRTSGIYVSKDKLRLFHKRGALDQYVQVDTGFAETLIDRLVADLAEPETRWDLTFVHIADPDTIGHLEGWMSRIYLDAVKKSDELVGRILAALAENGLLDETLLIVTADHGGYLYGHEGGRPEVDNIPWIASGPGVPRGASIARPVGTHDTAPTLLRALGLGIPAGMEGTAIEGLFLPPSSRFLRGDANADGAANLTDAIVILEALFRGGTVACALAGDTNADAALGLTDAIYLLNFLFAGGRKLPPPSPACGMVTQPVSFDCTAPCS